jgi:hypothetical protein
MYINFKLLNKKGFEVLDLILLQLAKQNKSEDLSSDISLYSLNRIENLVSKGYLTYIKGNKSDSEFQRLRLTKSGSNFLEDIETPEVLEEDLLLFDWISDVYSSLGKDIGNKKKTKMYIAQFRVQSGIEKNHLAILLDEFVKDDNNMEYNMKLEFAFFKPSNVFQVKFELEQSRLYTYYTKRKSFFDNIFSKLEVEEAA